MAARSASAPPDGLGRGLGWLLAAAVLLGLIDKTYELRAFQDSVVWLRDQGAIFSRIANGAVGLTGSVAHFYSRLAYHLFYFSPLSLSVVVREDVLFGLMLALYSIYLLVGKPSDATNITGRRANGGSLAPNPKELLWPLIRPFHAFMFDPVFILSITLLVIYQCEQVDSPDLQIFGNGLLVVMAGVILLYCSVFSFFDLNQQRLCGYFALSETLLLFFGGVSTVCFGLYVMLGCSYCQPLL